MFVILLLLEINREMFVNQGSIIHDKYMTNRNQFREISGVSPSKLKFYVTLFFVRKLYFRPALYHQT